MKEINELKEKLEPFQNGRELTLTKGTMEKILLILEKLDNRGKKGITGNVELSKLMMEASLEDLTNLFAERRYNNEHMSWSNEERKHCLDVTYQEAMWLLERLTALEAEKDKYHVKCNELEGELCGVISKAEEIKETNKKTLHIEICKNERGFANGSLDYEEGTIRGRFGMFNTTKEEILKEIEDKIDEIMGND